MQPKLTVARYSSRLRSIRHAKAPADRTGPRWVRIGSWLLSCDDQGDLVASNVVTGQEPVILVRSERRH